MHIFMRNASLRRQSTTWLETTARIQASKFTWWTIWNLRFGIEVSPVHLDKITPSQYKLMAYMEQGVQWMYHPGRHYGRLIGPLALALVSNPSQTGICDPLSHLGPTCQEGDHILAPGGKQKYQIGEVCCTFAERFSTRRLCGSYMEYFVPGLYLEMISGG